MRRISLATVLSAAALLTTPGIAAAAHGGRAHHRAHNAHSRRHVRRRHAAGLAPAGAPAVILPAAYPPLDGAPAPSPPAARPATLAGTIAATEGVGTVQSFTAGVLTIALSDGTMISGAVTESTDIRCPAAKGSEGGDESAGDDGEEGSESKGDDGEEGSESKGDDGEEGSESKGDDGEASPGGERKAGGEPEARAGAKAAYATEEGGDDGGSTEACTTAALTPGAIVGRAELSLSSAGPVWDRIELAS
jgi:hypothetical protein